MENDKITIVVELLKKIHEFYPIGLPHYNDAYPGYKNLLSITEEKINNLVEMRIDTWDHMIKSLETELIYKIKDESFLQFPNRSFRIEFNDEFHMGIIVKRNVHLYISLLHNSYTYFVKHDFIIDKIQIFSILSTRQTEGDSELFTLLKSKLKQYYSNYNYVSHKLLFSFKIQGGTPHGEIFQPNTGYSLFSFLFGLSPDYQNISIQD